MTDPVEARQTAQSLVVSLVAGDPTALQFEGANLAGALEQQLFFALRDGRGRPGRMAALGAMVGDVVRPAAAGVLGLAAARLPSPGSGPIALLVRDPAHYPVIEQVEAELQRLGGESLALVRVGRAAQRTPKPGHAIAPRLQDMFHGGSAAQVLACTRRLRRALGGASGEWDRVAGAERGTALRAIASAEVGRIALGAAAIRSVIDRWRPSAFVAFDEVGTWARILPAVASVHDVPTLDLPHAEAADTAAIQGVAYDAMAVYGPRAAAVLVAAGYPRSRVVEIGAPRFDPLLDREADRAQDGPPKERRVVFAAQYVSGAMQPDVHAACLRASVAAAAAVGAAELTVLPHPAEPPGTARGLVDALHDRSGLPIRVAPAGTLHHELEGAWLLVTGWSNSVFEAAVLGIPALTVNPGGVAPVDFAADGLALGSVDEASAAVAARSLLDRATRDGAVTRARDAAEDRLGELDGHASERAARLVLAIARREFGAPQP